MGHLLLLQATHLPVPPHPNLMCSGMLVLVFARNHLRDDIGEVRRPSIKHTACCLMHAVYCTLTERAVLRLLCLPWVPVLSPRHMCITTARFDMSLPPH